MKRAAVATSAALAATLGLAAPAGADTTSEKFLDDPHARGFNGGQTAMLYNGSMVCSLLRHGITPAAVLAEMLRTTTMTPGDAGVFAALAVADLCPQFSNEAVVGRAAAALGEATL